MTTPGGGGGRYSRTPVLGLGFQYGTSYTIPTIREQIKRGNIKVDRVILEESERLDILAAKYYGDGRLWWIICAASDIGFAPQAPPGTTILIPNMDDITRFIGS